MYERFSLIHFYKIKERKNKMNKKKKLSLFFEIIYIIVLIYIIVKGIAVLDAYNEPLHTVKFVGVVEKISNGVSINRSDAMLVPKISNGIKFTIHQLTLRPDGALGIIFEVDDLDELKNNIVLVFLDENNNSVGKLIIDKEEFESAGISYILNIDDDYDNGGEKLDKEAIVASYDYELQFD